MKLEKEIDENLNRRGACDQCLLHEDMCDNMCADEGYYIFPVPPPVPPKTQTEYEWKLERYTLLKERPRVPFPPGSVDPLLVEQEDLERWLKSNQPLKPCPFCGGEAFVKPVDTAGLYTVGCSNMACVCCHRNTGWNASGDALAIRKWNKREGAE